MTKKIGVQGHCTPFTQRHSLGEVWTWLGQEEWKFSPGKWTRTDGHDDWRVSNALSHLSE